MSELTSDPPTPDESSPAEKSSSPRSMLVTMTLLIAALSLTGMMLLHSAAGRAQPAEGDAVDTVQRGGFNFAALTRWFDEKKANSNTNQPAAAVAETPTTESASTGFKLFGKRGNGARWPKLKLTGFGSSAEGNGGFAIINDEETRPGQLIDGKVELVEVREHDVLVRYQGETKLLKVDGSD